MGLSTHVCTNNDTPLSCRSNVLTSSTEDLERDEKMGSISYAVQRWGLQMSLVFF
jgi:hypothetical protein